MTLEKMKFKKIISLILFGCFIYFSSYVTYAEEIDKPSIEVQLIDEKTGENLLDNIVVTEIDSLKGLERTGSNIVSYTVDISLPKLNRSSNSSSQTTSDVKSIISVNYDKTGNTLRMNKIFGNWQILNSAVLIENRRVDYQDCYSYHYRKQTPTANNFTYITNWEYVPYEVSASGSALGPYAESGATVRISGMGSGYSVHAKVVL